MSFHRANPSEAVVKRAQATGDAGRDWLEGLGDLVLRLAADWELGIGRPLRGGTEAYVVEAMTLAGETAVLKIYMPGADPTRSEMRVLRRANGRGYARLLKYDDASGAMLLERLGVQLSEQGYGIEQRHRIICDTLREAWTFPEDGEVFVTGAEKADALAAMIQTAQRALGNPVSPAAVEMALACCERRRAAYRADTAVLAHGDAHQWNTLYAPGPGDGQRYKFVDPDGLFIERAYDLGISMREDADDLLEGDALKRGRARAERLSRLTGVEVEPIWEWGVIERLATGLNAMEIGYAEWSEPMLRVSEIWAKGSG